MFYAFIISLLIHGLLLFAHVLPEKSGHGEVYSVSSYPHVSLISAREGKAKTSVQKVSTKKSALHRRKPELRSGEGSKSLGHKGRKVFWSLFTPYPSYPDLSRKHGEEGTVHLSVKTNSQGYIEQISLKKSSGYGRLDQAALNKVKTWRMRPSLKGIVPLTFKLKD